MIPASCASCGGALQTKFAQVEDPHTRERFSILACSHCGLGHTSPAPDDLGRYYGGDYYGGRHGLTQALCLFRRVRLLERFGAASGVRRLLDVGCGDGSFLFAARERGWEAAGTERHPQRAGAGPAVYASLSDAGSGYGCVTLWHSLEHLPDPRGALADIAARLVPGGTVLLAVPNAEGAQARLFGAAWRHLDVPRHLFHFGLRSLEEMLRGAGLAPFWRWHQEIEYDLLGWTQSALNQLPGTHDLLLRTLSFRDRSPAKLAAGMALAGALGALALPAAVATALVGSGGTLMIAARRPP